MTHASELVARIERASLVELASASFLADGVALGSAEVERVTDALLDAIARKNQFASAEPRLAEGVTKAMAELAKEEGGVSRCRAALVALFRDVLGPSPREVLSATYSPELQLRVLGLSPCAMRDPILDVGAGDGSLVRHLRAAGRDARGIDVRGRSDVVERASWLSYEYGEGRWGTIVSHLGFTLHFMHQEMKRSDLAFEYGRAYMRIVRSLARGGTFAYVPAVPFIESLLPKTYRVVQVPLARDLVVAAVEHAQDATGLVLDASTHVVRQT